MNTIFISNLEMPKDEKERIVITINYDGTVEYDRYHYSSSPYISGKTEAKEVLTAIA